MSAVIAAFIIGALVFTAAFGLVLAGLAWLSRSIGRRRLTTQGEPT